MKYLFVLLALGTLFCATLSAPANSNVQRENTDLTNEEFLDMISRVTKESQSDEDDNDSPAEAQWGFFKKLARKFRRYKPLRKWVGRVIRGAIRSHVIPLQDNKDEENAMIEAVLNSITKEQGDDYNDGVDTKAIQSDEDDDDSPAEAQWGFFKRVFRKHHRNRLLKKLAGKVLSRAIGLYQQGNGGEENASIEAVLNSKLESLAREQGDDYDDDDGAKASQSDEDDDSTLAEAQWGFFKRLLHKFRRYKPIRKLVRKVVSGVIRSHMNPQLNNENGLIQEDDEDGSDDDGVAEAENDAMVQAFLEKLMERDTDNMAAIESLPEDAQDQFLFTV